MTYDTLLIESRGAVTAADLRDEAIKNVTIIPVMPPLAAMAVKEMVDAAYETYPSQGLRFKRRLFRACSDRPIRRRHGGLHRERPGVWTGA